MSDTIVFHGLHTLTTQVGNEKTLDEEEVFPRFTDFTPVGRKVYVPSARARVCVGARPSSPTRSTVAGKSVKRGKSWYVKGCFHPTRCEVPCEIHGVPFEEVAA